METLGTFAKCENTWSTSNIQPPPCVSRRNTGKFWASQKSHICPLGLAAQNAQLYKRVHEDVAILEGAGLIVREDGRLSAPWDALTAEVSL